MLMLFTYMMSLSYSMSSVRPSWYSCGVYFQDQESYVNSSLFPEWGNWALLLALLSPHICFLQTTAHLNYHCGMKWKCGRTLLSFIIDGLVMPLLCQTSHRVQSCSVKWEVCSIWAKGERIISVELCWWTFYAYLKIPLCIWMSIAD